jgi:quercetin dioxygenase-like cupin family protein
MSQGELVEDPGLKMRHRFTAVEGGLEVESWIAPGGGVTPHVHPVMSERFEVLAGQAQILRGREWIDAGPGDVVEILPNTRHAFRNRSDGEAHLKCLASPGQTLQPFLEDAAALGRAGVLKGGWPAKPSALLQAAVLVEEHKDMVTLLFPPLPPPAVQRVLFPPLAKLAARRGYVAGRLGDRHR